MNRVDAVDKFGDYVPHTVNCVAVIALASPQDNDRTFRQQRRIKMVEITEDNTRRALPTRLTMEQKEILRKLGVPAPEKMSDVVV